MIHNISRFIAALALMLTATQGAWAWDGSGTAESPYQIKSTADLDQLATDVNSGTEHEGDYFVLTTDLTYDPDVLTIDNDNDGTNESNYTPIGGYNDKIRYFKGHFDGQSHTISGIRIYQIGSDSEKRYAALFGVIDGAEVKNVFLADARFTGYYYCGPIVGYNRNGRVENCHVLSNVTVHTVTTDAHFHGGVVGYNAGTITGCTSAASITAAVSCKYNGGITGQGSGTVEDCIYFGSTVAGDSYVGAIIGSAASGSTIRNCYYISTTFQGKENHGYTLANDASAIGYKTSGVTIDDARLATSDDFAVSGDTYTIGTAAGWSVMCAALYHNDTYNRFSGKTVQLGADITVTRMAGGQNHAFTGTFDGGDHTLTVSISSSDGNAAPFREIMGATIRNLKVSGTVSGTKHSAGLVSYARGADSSVENTIENCLVATDVSTIVDTDGDCYLGGIVGHGFNCKLTIRGSAFTGSLTSPHNYTGGLQGWSDGNTLILEDDIFAASSVNAANVGFHPIAIHANNMTTTATVTNVYYTVAPTCTTTSRIAAAGKQAHTVAAGENVTLALSGTATEYGVSGITVYESNHGIKFGTTYYAGSDDQLSLTLSNTATGAPLGYQYGYTASAGTLSGSTLTMPDQDVTITAALRSDGLQHEVSYMTADGTTQTAKAIALDGHEAVDGDGYLRLDEGTYYVGTDIAYANEIRPGGNITLILADRKTMTLASDVMGINRGNNLTIYGQSLDAATAGTLRYDGTSDGITANNYEQHSGNVRITTTGSGVRGIGACVTLQGGTLTVSANGDDARAISSIMHSILGGQLTANATGAGATGIRASASSGTVITLGWTNPADRITASSISTPNGGTVAVKDGQALTDGSGHIYTGTLSADDLAALAGKTLQPWLVLNETDGVTPLTALAGQANVPVIFSRTFSANVASTICLPFAISADQATAAGKFYTFAGVDTSGSDWVVTMQEANATTAALAANTPYLFMPSSSSEVTFSGTIANVADSYTAGTTNSGKWTYRGTYATIEWPSDPGNIYGFASGQAYGNTGDQTEAGKFIRVHTGGIRPFRAYLQYSGSGNARAMSGSSSSHELPETMTVRLIGADGQTSAIGTLDTRTGEATFDGDAWYTLDGVKLSAKPTAKGIYIYKGKKVIIK